MKSKLFALTLALAAMLPAQSAVPATLAPLPARSVLVEYYRNLAWFNLNLAALSAMFPDASTAFMIRAQVYFDVSEDMETFGNL